MIKYLQLLPLFGLFIPTLGLARSYAANNYYDNLLYQDTYTRVYDGRGGYGYYGSSDVDYGLDERSTRVRNNRYRSRYRYYSDRYGRDYGYGQDCWREEHVEPRCYDYDRCDSRDVYIRSQSTVYCNSGRRYSDLRHRYRDNYNYRRYDHRFNRYHNSRNNYDSYYYNDGYRDRNRYHYYNY